MRINNQDIGLATINSNHSPHTNQAFVEYLMGGLIVTEITLAYVVRYEYLFINDLPGGYFSRKKIT